MSRAELVLAPIEIRPEVTVLSVLRHLNYKAWFAIAEFIDNSLQSAISNREKLTAIHGQDYQLVVDVRLDASELGNITITDNAAGISISDFPRAFRAAQVPTDRNGLSEFGMGMKSAACWFAERWDVRTTAIGETVERTIHFDVKHIVENKIESLNTETRTARPEAHYTVVSLRGLHHRPQGRTVTKIKEHLASIYRVFLRDGRLVLKFDGQPLSYQTPKVLSAVRYVSPGVTEQGDGVLPLNWRKDILLDFGNGQRVTGFAALREVGSTPLAGFALFRRDRLIVGSHDETYRPTDIFRQTNSYPYQRLFGELHVEGFEVSHTKDGIRWEEHEEIFLEELRKQIEEPPLNLLTQAENYRALPAKKSIEARAITATASVADHLEKEVAPLLVEAREYPAEPDQLPHDLAHSLLQASERTVDIDDGSWRWIINLRTSVDPSKDEWVSLAKKEQEEGDTNRIRRLSIDLSLAHPFSMQFIGANNENVELLLRVASAVCISLVLTEDLSGDPPQNFLFHFNYLLRGALTRTGLNVANFHHDSQQDQAPPSLGT